MKTKFYPKAGDKVYFQFFNTPDGKFYGDIHTGTIEEVIKDHEFCKFNPRDNWNPVIETGYRVIVDNFPPGYVLRRKEIKGKAG